MKAIYVAITLFLMLISGIIFANEDEIDYHSAENIYKFADHLYQEKDYARSAGEYERYLLIAHDKNDIALYRLGFCYRNIGEIQKAINIFAKLRNDYEDWAFPATYQMAYSYLVSDQYENLASHINNSMQEMQSVDHASKLRILLSYGHLEQRQWSSATKVLDMIPTSDNNVIVQRSNELKGLSIEGSNFKRKSRLLASVLSMVVPGAGKIYCGQYGNGIYSFASVSTTGFLAFRGFRNDGISSVKGWIFGSLCAIFYSGNIYGSGISALAYNRQKEDEILMRLPLLHSEW